MQRSPCRGHRFPPEIIRHAVWLYLRFTLSFRDVEELLAERGLDISYETIRRWVLKFGPQPAAPAVDVKTLHAKIGELTLTNDFLSGALGKAG